jgi:hypothetical protein
MPSGLLNLALGLAIQVGTPGPSETPNFPAPANAYGRHGFEGSSEQRYPFDTQQNWVHGYFQDIPAYGGHHTYRPYNYKDVLSQSQTAAGWGERPTMPYSKQFWHKYQDQATMLKTSQAAPIWTPQIGSRFAPDQVGWSPAVPGSQIVVPTNSVPSYGNPLATPAQATPLPNVPNSFIAEPIQGPALQQADYIINPASYQQPAPRGGRR